MPELTNPNLCVHSRVDSNTFNMVYPMLESTLTLCQSRLYPPIGTLDLASGRWRWHRDRVYDYDMSTEAVLNFFLFKLTSKLTILLKVVTNEKWRGVAKMATVRNMLVLLSFNFVAILFLNLFPFPLTTAQLLGNDLLIKGCAANMTLALITHQYNGAANHVASIRYYILCLLNISLSSYFRN